jgi:hypothetical protein
MTDEETTYMYVSIDQEHRIRLLKMSELFNLDIQTLIEGWIDEDWDTQRTIVTREGVPIVVSPAQFDSIPIPYEEDM